MSVSTFSYLEVEKISETLSKDPNIQQLAVIEAELNGIDKSYYSKTAYSDGSPESLIRRTLWYLYIANRVAFSVQYKLEPEFFNEQYKKLLNKKIEGYPLKEAMSEFGSLMYNIYTNDGNVFLGEKFFNVADIIYEYTKQFRDYAKGGMTTKMYYIVYNEAHGEGSYAEVPATSEKEAIEKLKKEGGVERIVRVREMDKDEYAKGGELEDKYKVISITRVVGGMNPKFRIKFKDGKVMRSDEQNEFIDSKYYKSMNKAISEYEYEEPFGATSHEDLYNYAKGGKLKGFIKVSELKEYILKDDANKNESYKTLNGDKYVKVSSLRTYMKNDEEYAKGGKLTSNSKEVREKIRQHILDSVYDENEEEFDTFGQASKELAEEFKRVADYSNNLQKIPNNQNRFRDYLLGIPYYFEFENYKLEEFLNGLGINPENKEYDYDQMHKLYSSLIWREIQDDYNRYAKGGEIQKRWIKSAGKKKEGNFIEEAESRNMSVGEFGKKVLKNTKHYKPKLRQQAQMVKNMGVFAKGGVVKPKNLAFSDKHYYQLANALDKVINRFGEKEIKDYLDENNGHFGRYQLQKQATNRISMSDDNLNIKSGRWGIAKDDNWRKEANYTDKQYDSAVKSILRQRLGIKVYAKGGSTNDWVQKVEDNPDFDEGGFSSEAKERGISTQELFNKVMENPKRYSEKLHEQAIFMENAYNFKVK